MTGFLRRLASGTLHANRAIHPDVGSVWSAPRNQEPIELSGEILVSSRPDNKHDPSSIHPAPESSVQEAVPHRRTDRIDQMHRSEPVVKSAIFTPLIPTSQSIAVSAPRPSDPTHHNESLWPTRQDTLLEQPASRAIHGELTPRPLLPSTWIAPPHPVAGHKPGPYAREPLPAQTQAAEPDIEIHIGRIEVLAASPPPPQPAPRPARKSLDLGEYLSRDRRRR